MYVRVVITLNDGTTIIKYIELLDNCSNISISYEGFSKAKLDKTIKSVVFSK